jgi:16S rRNA (cytidine1402-2'-O)-methyltransferase
MGKLYLVPTPIGNLSDITLRSVDVLKSVDLILAEDTRTSAVLLRHHNINTRVSSFHQFNEHKVVAGFVTRMSAGENIALITDAGTPGISDPGYLLVQECLKKNVAIECLPGPTALIPALVLSGLPCDRFCFEGFLPVKKGRKTKFLLLAEEDRTVVFYESPHRVLKTLGQLSEYCGPERKLSVSREISKMFEETIRGSISEIEAHFKQNAPRGEFVFVLSGKSH